MVLTEQDETADRRAFGRFLASLRDAHGLTQAELAEAVEVNQSYVAAIESGRKQASDKFIEGVAEKLDLRAERLRKIRDITRVAASLLIPGPTVYHFARGIRNSLQIRNEISIESDEPSTADWPPLFIYPWPQLDVEANARRKAIVDSLANLTEGELQRVQDFIAGISSPART